MTSSNTPKGPQTKNKAGASQKPDPRREAARIVGRVLRDNAYANRMLNAVFQSEEWDSRDRALLTELVYGVIRHLYAIDHALDQVAQKGVSSIDPAILNHLRVAVYQLLFLDRIAPHAILDQAVRYVRQLRGQRVGGFVNALLRNIQRNPERYIRIDPLLQLPESLSLSFSHPQWLVERWLRRLGPEATRQRLAAHNMGSPLVFRVHGPKGSREEALAKLHEQDIKAEATRWSPEGVRILGSLPTSLHRFLAEFPLLLVPQDEAAQLVVQWLQPENDDLILDACAAPGGKTTHIASLAPEAQLVGCDIHPHKLSLIETLSQRLGITSTITTEEDLAPQPGAIQLFPKNGTKPFAQSFDRILCDAPCSGLGILRKQPEIRYRRSVKEIEEMAAVQKQLLNNLSEALRPGGTLVYSVCTDTPEENEQVMDAFLQEHPEFHKVTSQEGLPWAALLQEDGSLRTSPEVHGMDAFYAVKLKKDE
ncbi:MAG: 16S rRNA (cytosine(967)-C(5))-methyltransferase RsmB [Deltaproteobacteria bacterium]|nr:MAG: 16S rRNA (cytosine(967)-C(5))-methyltransferase RsmB [Deltaproteobacteria bacterium]